MQDTKWTIVAIKEAMNDRGSHWWDEDSMAFFGTRVDDKEVSQGPGGVFFVSSEKPPHGPRKYSVRQFFPESCEIRTLGEFCAMTRKDARKLARRAADGLEGES